MIGISLLFILISVSQKYISVHEFKLKQSTLKNDRLVSIRLIKLFGSQR